jgi:hypothetical protein
MSQSADCVPQYHWFDFVQMSGTEGRRWVEEYRRVQPLVKQVLNPLELLRAGELETGSERLARAGDALAAREFESPSLRALMERWYYGVLGFAHYARDEHDAADACMARALDALADAVRRSGFLLVMADDAFELVLHRARIARNRRRWAEMWQHLDTGDALRHGRRPYGEFGDGSPVWVSTLVEHLDNLPVPPEAQPVLRRLQDADERRATTESSIRAVVRLSGFAIPHP